MRAADQRPTQDEVLVRLPRADGSELRLTRSTFRGRPSIHLRSWVGDRRGRMIPTPVGFVLTEAEASALAAALARCDAAKRPARPPGTAKPPRRSEGLLGRFPRPRPGRPMPAWITSTQPPEDIAPDPDAVPPWGTLAEPLPTEQP
jgi:hypothetical protein